MSEVERLAVDARFGSLMTDAGAAVEAVYEVLDDIHTAEEAEE